MLEATVAASIAIATGLGAVMTRQNPRVQELDRRIDTIELRVAEKYVTRDELVQALNKMEAHMVRIENKLDRIAIHG